MERERQRLWAAMVEMLESGITTTGTVLDRYPGLDADPMAREAWLHQTLTRLLAGQSKLLGAMAFLMKWQMEQRDDDVLDAE